MAKPPPLRIPSDDCIVTVAGVDYDVHAGEWVEVIPGIAVGDFDLIAALDGLVPEMQSLEADAQLPELKDGETHAPEVLARVSAARSEMNRIATERMHQLAPFVMSRIHGWNWTDMRGEPLPCPSADPNVYKRLRPEEMGYLVRAVKGDIEVERKNGSRPLPSTSGRIKSSTRMVQRANRG